MKIINSRGYQFLIKVTNYFLLNLLFLFFCLPIITIGPAINSLFRVIHALKYEGQESILMIFIKHFFNKNILLNSIIGISSMFLISLYINIINNLTPIPNQMGLLILIVLFISILLNIGLYINYFLLVSKLDYRVRLKRVFMRVLSYTVLNLGSTILSAILCLVSAVMIYAVPIVIFFVIPLLIIIILSISKNKRLR